MTIKIRNHGHAAPSRTSQLMLDSMSSAATRTASLKPTPCSPKVPDRTTIMA